MSTNTQQTAIQPDGKSAASASIIPTVTYDSVNRVITAEVAVSQQPGASTIAILASPVTVLPGIWTVHWELHMLTAWLEARFDNPGIALLKIPTKATLLTGPTGTDSLWTVQIKNDAGTGLSFPYEIAVKSGASTTKKQIQADQQAPSEGSGDPVKVQDPLDPPSLHVP